MNNLNKLLNDSEVTDCMLHDLKKIVADLKNSMQIEPETYTELGTDGPSIDIRLCIDFKNHAGWLFRVGSSDFDTYHSEFCAASSVDLNTKAYRLLDDLINQLTE